MRKTIVTFIVFIIFTIGTMLPVFAAAPTYDFYCSYSTMEEGVARTGEITLQFSVKDFKNFSNQSDGGQNGVNVIRAILEYDEDVFEKIEINTTSEGYYNGIATTTAKGDKAIQALGNWSGLTYNPDTKKIIVESGQFVNFEDVVLQITLTAKTMAPLGETTITLKDIEASDKIKDINPKTPKISKKVEVISSSGPITDADPENGFGGYIRFKPNMKVSQVRETLENDPEYIPFDITGVMKNEQGTTLSDSDYAPTGTTIIDGNGKLTYTLIFVGDVNSDGKTTATDLSQLKAHMVGNITLNDNQKRACDIKWDTKLYGTDNSRLKNMLVGISDPNVRVWDGSDDPKDATCFPVDKKSN